MRKPQNLATASLTLWYPMPKCFFLSTLHGTVVLSPTETTDILFLNMSAGLSSGMLINLSMYSSSNKNLIAIPTQQRMRYNFFLFYVFLHTKLPLWILDCQCPNSFICYAVHLDHQAPLNLKIKGEKSYELSSILQMEMSTLASLSSCIQASSILIQENLTDIDQCSMLADHQGESALP